MSGNHLAMSDEDFLKQAEPETVQPVVVENPQNETPADEQVPENQGQDPSGDLEIESNDSDPNSEGETEGEKDPSEDPEEGTEKEPTPKEEKESDPSGSAEGKDPEDKNKPADQASEEAPNYEGFYQQIMKPFTANGKQITVRNAEEAVSLMQMGANFTKKMQELAPYRKLHTMLQNNDLLDEGKLSFLIDLDKKDPEAIKKLLKDSGIDPLDIDTKEDSAYQEGRHTVSDDEVAFRTQVQELGSTDEGRQTLQEITGWDQASKDVLWKNPEVLSVINEHRVSGVYATIASEIDRRRTLGQIPASTPFLEAYKTIGDSLYPGKPTEQTAQEEAPKQIQKDPVIKGRTIAPKVNDGGDDKAEAAAHTRGSPGKAKVASNYLSMSDDDFAKLDQFGGRV